MSTVPFWPVDKTQKIVTTLFILNLLLCITCFIISSLSTIFYQVFLLWNSKKKKSMTVIPFNSLTWIYINKLIKCSIYFLFKWIQNKVLIAKLSINWNNFSSLIKKKKRWDNSVNPLRCLSYKTELKYARDNYNKTSTGKLNFIREYNG